MSELFNRDVTVGIDPGLKGAIAVLSHETGELLAVHDMPTKKGLTKKTSTVIDPAGVTLILQAWAYRCAVIAIERVGSRPGEGHVGAFRFGQGHGILIGCAAALGLEIAHPLPQQWKKTTMCKGLTKDECTERAQEAHPAVILYSKHKNRSGGQNALDGRADAILITHHATSLLANGGVLTPAEPGLWVRFFGLDFC